MSNYAHIQKKKKKSLLKKGINGKITVKSNVLNKLNIKHILITKPTSPTLFKTIAFKADLFDSKIENQKFINRKETNPTPSQPTNNCKRLSDVTNINMNHVNKDKYAINLILKASSAI
jgi:hypothetical protein